MPKVRKFEAFWTFVKNAVLKWCNCGSLDRMDCFKVWNDTYIKLNIIRASFQSFKRSYKPFSNNFSLNVSNLLNVEEKQRFGKCVIHPNFKLVSQHLVRQSRSLKTGTWVYLLELWKFGCVKRLEVWTLCRIQRLQDWVFETLNLWKIGCLNVWSLEWGDPRREQKYNN